MSKHPYTTVDEYLTSFEGPRQRTLLQLRSLIFETVPGVEEKLSWGAPTYYLGGYLVQFAGYAGHIGFYTSPATLAHFQEALTPYPTNHKNTTQFSWNDPLPVSLIRDMLCFRVQEITK